MEVLKQPGQDISPGPGSEALEMRLPGFPGEGHGQVLRSRAGGWFDCHWITINRPGRFFKKSPDSGRGRLQPQRPRLARDLRGGLTGRNLAPGRRLITRRRDYFALFHHVAFGQIFQD